MKTTIYFIRHGQTDWNVELRFQGQQDIPVNDIGREQARRNGRVLRGLVERPDGFDFVASPLSRTRETMQIIRAEMGLDSAVFQTDSRLMELNYGDWEGTTLEEMQRAYGELSKVRNRDKWNFVPPGKKAESYAMQADRFAPWLAEIQRPTVCVTHGGILRCVWNIVGGLSSDEAGLLDIPQDRVLRLENDALDWL